ncbi:MAG: OmpA family protein [Polyangiales bacterium]
MRFSRLLPPSALLLLASLSSNQASAQQQGFALDRFEPSDRGSDWFHLDSLDLRGNVRPAIGATFDWAHRPLVLVKADGNGDTALVKDQYFLHIGAAIILIERLKLAFSLPIAVGQTSDVSSVTVSGQTYGSPSKASVGDVRLSAMVRILGTYGDPFTLAGGLWAWIPSGSRDQYTGDGKFRIQPHLDVAGDISLFTYAARVGANYRALNETFADAPTGTELAFGASAGIRLVDKKLLIGPEIWGTTVLVDGGAFQKKTTPVEGVFGVHYNFGDFRIGGGAGPGFTRGFGAPELRVLASVDYFPAIEEKKPEPKPEPKPEVKVEPPKDKDGDGILDVDDACVDVPGKKTDDPKTNGCPDKDGDGVFDKDDACVDVPGIKTDDPKTNGCPDKDGDGITDAVDACPDVKGVKTDDPKTNGCPPDKDGDGVLDPDDACPDTPGPKNEDPKKNGCPAVAIVGTQIKIIEQVKFKTGSAVIEKESDAILEGVAKILKDHPELKKIRVEGHTDNVGAKAMNKDLSKKRAASVVAWLLKHGVEKSRLSSQGFGDEKPIDDNSTPEGRKNNRRVEFHIEDLEGGKGTKIETK